MRGPVLRFWGADIIFLSVIYCATADTSDEDWEVALSVKIMFQVFFTAPHHSIDSDVVLFFRTKAPSRWFREPNYFPLALHVSPFSL